jgi:thioredoxin-related protein
MVMKTYIKLVGLFLLVLLPQFLMSQDRGVKFVQENSWEDVCHKAQKEKKNIFLDCYTTWCGPCKYMDWNIYSKEPIGDLLNNSFVSVRVQMNETPNDNDYVKSWRSFARRIKKKYSVNAYPTFLFFSSNGNALDHKVGSVGDVSGFIALIQSTMHPERQYYTLLNKVREKKDDSLFLRNLLITAMEMSDLPNTKTISRYYFGSVIDKFNKENIKFMESAMSSIDDEYFKFYRQNHQKIDSIFANNNYAERTLSVTYYKDKIRAQLEDESRPFIWAKVVKAIHRNYPEIEKKMIEFEEKMVGANISKRISERVGSTTEDVNWGVIEKAIQNQFPDYSIEESMLKYKLDFYSRKQNWTEYSRVCLVLIRKYRDRISDFDFNDLSWSVFLHSDNNELLLETIKWMRQLMERSPNMETIDTYAGLLYKSGMKEEAIIWEGKAYDLVSKDSVYSKKTHNIIKTNYEKMKRGEATWE